MKQHLVAYIFGQPKVGFTFRAWPLHITIVPWFMGGKQLAIDTVEAIAARTPPLTVKLGEAAMFGPHNNVPVRRIINTLPLQALHQALLAALQQAGLQFHSTRYCGRKFNPYITNKRKLAMPAGPINIDRLHLVELDTAITARSAPNRQVVHDIQLGGGHGQPA